MVLSRQFFALCLSTLLIAGCNKNTDVAATPSTCLDNLNAQITLTNDAANLLNAAKTSLNQWLIAYATPDHSQLPQLLANIEGSALEGSISGAFAGGSGIHSYAVCLSQNVDSKNTKDIFAKVKSAKAKAKATALASTDECTNLFTNFSNQIGDANTALAQLETSLKSAVAVASDPSKIKSAMNLVLLDSFGVMAKVSAIGNTFDENKNQFSTCSSPNSAKK